MLSRTDNELLTRTGATTPMGGLFRQFWLPAMLASELPQRDGPPVRLRLLGEDLVAFRDTEGRVGVLEPYCPHRGAPLFLGRNEECGLRCVYHGWKFDVTGRCVDMGNVASTEAIRGKIRQRAYAARESTGVIWVYMGSKDPPPELPALDWLGLPDDHVYVHKRIQACNYLQNVEGEVDSSHVTFLHRFLDLEVQKKFFGPNVEILFRQGAPRFEVLETAYGLMIGAQRAAGDAMSSWRVTQFLLPTYTIIPTLPGDFSDFTAAVPIDDVTMIGWTVAWRPDRPLTEADRAKIDSGDYLYSQVDPATFRLIRNADNGYQQDRELQRTHSYTGIRGTRDQDAAVQEGMGPIVDRSKEHLTSADVAVIALRRLYLRLLADIARGADVQAVHRPESYRVRAGQFTAAADASFEVESRSLATPVGARQ
jgi:phenylpropionate dioxygenase-like ring-hydroxylating dioxygenase large terminal subunit